jgi:putative tryptophan/tyrosine transport system substrate-binding protein
LLNSKVAAVSVNSDPFFYSRRGQLTALPASHAVPAIYEVREFTTAGGLMSYGTSITDAYRQAGVYVGRLLKGESAGDRPIQQPVKFEFVINLKTAKFLGIDVATDVARALVRSSNSYAFCCDCSLPVVALLGSREMSDLSPK